ncbi:hypothetical protein FB451DRAFT_1258089 [Mycena latifolia]|nr:hypothetical protein FB451DRAFT_1258089 [Mycena latifolia]
MTARNIQSLISTLVTIAVCTTCEVRASIVGSCIVYFWPWRSTGSFFITLSSRRDSDFSLGTSAIPPSAVIKLE